MGAEGFRINTREEVFQEIRKEYKKIDQDWLRLHYKTTIGLVFFASVIEIIMGMFLIHSDMLVSSNVSQFIVKYMIVPIAINSLCLAIASVVIKSDKFSQEQKIYTVCRVFVGICFILYTVHSTFMVICYIFAIAIMLTAIYASYRVTIITSLTSIVAFIYSELFIVWDLDKESIFTSTHRLSQFFIAIFILISFSAVCMVVIRFERKKNEASIQLEIERQQLEKHLQVDEMTGIYNRRALRSALKAMEDDQESRYILAIADIDNFKNINDQWGHHVGDICIINFAKILTSDRENVTAFRYGGDEFCLLFRNVGMGYAVAICEQIQSDLHELPLDGYPRLKLTTSFGLAAYSSQIDAVRLVANADKALYEAKEARNAIRVYKNRK